MAAAVPVENQRFEQRSKIKFVVVHREGIEVGLSNLGSDMFQPHGGLAFEGDFAREAKQGGGRVKKPAHRRRDEASNIFLNEFQRIVVPGREVEWGKGEVEIVELR